MSEAAEFHPRYCSDGDIVLLSRDNVKLRVHSAILKISSDFFRQMFELPQPSDTAGMPIQMDEEGALLALLFDLVYPRGSLPVMDDINVVARVADIAKKFEMTRALDTLGAIVGRNVQATDESYPPLDVYLVACRNGWTEAVQDASRKTLVYSLREVLDKLLRPVNGKKLELNARDALSLIAMHEKRKEQILDMVNPCFLHKQGCDFMTCPCITLTDEVDDESIPEWFEIPTNILQCSVGLKLLDSTDALALKDDSFWDSINFEKVWKHKCPICRTPIIDKKKYVSAVRQLIDINAVDYVIFPYDKGADRLKKKRKIA